MGLIHQLEEKRDFTKVESVIAQYILDHQEEVSDLNIRELAKCTFSSNAAIIRLCRKLGMDGFKEFRIAFAAELGRHDFEGFQGDVSHPFHKKDGPHMIIKRVGELSKEAVDSCYAAISPHVLGIAARWLFEARHIYILACGDTWISTMMFANMLAKISIFPVMATQYNENVAVTYSSNEQDVALFVSYSGLYMDTLKRELAIFRRNHCKTILITSRDSYEGVDQVISFPGKEDKFSNAAGYYSQMSIRYILNCLYGIIYSYNLEENQAYRSQATRANYPKPPKEP